MARYRKRRIIWRDRPLYNVRIPFEDGQSHLRRVDTVKHDVDMDDPDQHGKKRKRRGSLRKIDLAARGATIGYQMRHLAKEGVGGKPITEMLKEDLAAAGELAKSAFKRIGEAVGGGVVDAEEFLGAAEEPLLEAGTELAEFGIMLMV